MQLPVLANGIWVDKKSFFPCNMASMNMLDYPTQTICGQIAMLQVKDCRKEKDAGIIRSCL